MAEAALRGEKRLASLYLFDGGRRFRNRFGGSRFLSFASLYVGKDSGKDEWGN
jgi:hypothetical protein